MDVFVVEPDPREGAKRDLIRLPARSDLRVSLRLGHARGLTPHRGVIQDPRAASLPSTTRITEHAGLFCSKKPSERFNPRLPCVKGAVAAKPIVFKGFVRD